MSSCYSTVSYRSPPEARSMKLKYEQFQGAEKNNFSLSAVIISVFYLSLAIIRVRTTIIVPGGLFRHVYSLQEISFCDITYWKEKTMAVREIMYVLCRRSSYKFGTFIIKWKMVCCLPSCPVRIVGNCILHTAFCMLHVASCKKTRLLTACFLRKCHASLLVTIN